MTDLPITSGLILDIPFAGVTGPTYPDQSGNGNNLTVTDVGTPHSDTAQGLVCNGGTTGVFANTIVPYNCQTVIAVMSVPAPVGGSIDIFMGAASGGWNDWVWWFERCSTGTQNQVSQSEGYYVPEIGFNSIQGIESWMFPNVQEMVTWIFDPTTNLLPPNGTGTGQGDLYYISTQCGYEPTVFSEPLSQLSPPDTGSLLFGQCQTIFSGNYFSGTLQRLIIYDRPLSAAEIETLQPYIYADSLANNVVLGGLVNLSTTDQIFSDGDSISAAGGTNSTGDPVGTEAIDVSYAWQNVMLESITSMTSPSLWTYSISGQTAQGCASLFDSRRYRCLRAPKAKSVLFVFMGTNGFTSTPTDVVTSDSQAVTASSFQAAAWEVALGVQAGYEVVVIPLISRGNGSGGSLDNIKNTFNPLIYSTWGTESSPTVPHVWVIDESSMSPLCNDGTYEDGVHIETTYQTHPTNAGHAIIGAAAAARVNSITFPSGAGAPTTATLTAPGTTSGTNAQESGLWTITLDHSAPSGGITFTLLSSKLVDVFHAPTGGTVVTSVTVTSGNTTAQFKLVPNSLGSRYVGMTSLQVATPLTGYAYTSTGTPTLTASPSTATAYVGGPPVAVVFEQTNTSASVTASLSGGGSISTTSPSVNVPISFTLPGTPGTSTITFTDSTDNLTATSVITTDAVPSGGAYFASPYIRSN